MSNLPEKEYQIYDPTDTDDLVLWTPLDRQLDYVEDRALRLRVAESLPDAKSIAGPLDSQYEFNPLKDETVVLPVQYNFRLDSQRQHMLFLFITNTTIELHLPELWFVTGKPLEDTRRWKIIRDLTAKLSAAFGIEWKLAEYDGSDSEMRDDDAFWNTYLNNLFARIDYEVFDE